MMDEEEPSLEDILALGGTEEDLDLLRAKTRATSDDVSTSEVRDFIKSIGLTPGMMMEEEAEEKEEKSNMKTIQGNRKKRSKDDMKKKGDSNKHIKEIKSETKTKKLEECVVEKSTQKLKKEKKASSKEKKRSKESNGDKKEETTLSTTTAVQKERRKDRSKKKSAPLQTKDFEEIIPNEKLPDTSVTHEMTTKATMKAESELLGITFNEQKKLLVPFGQDSEIQWFQKFHSETSEIQYSLKVVNHLSEISRKVMNTELKLYKKAREQMKDKDVQWLKTVLSSGTLNDKMAALTLLVQESPVHTLSTVDQFVGMASKKAKRESILAIDSFKELLIADLLPEDRRLVEISQRPLHKLIESGKCDYHLLLLWYYEDQLKRKYKEFLATLQTLLHDPVAQIREKTLGVVFDLFYQKPEQEQLLLQLIVNKIGDPNRRIASKCVLLLLKLLNHHVDMKMIIIKEVESLLYRHNLSEKAQYYTICFLNQIVIKSNDQPLALKLVTIYFSFFKIYTSKDDFDAKILSALLTGVNRALPFLNTDIPSLEDHLNSLFKIVHVGPLATGIQSLVLLYQVMESRQAVSTRYYRALYQKMLDPRICISTTQQAMFLSLLFKSLKNDPELNRVKAFLKRILQICSYHSPHFICGCLVLISEVLKNNSSLWPYILNLESIAEEECFRDVVDDDETIEQMLDKEPSEGEEQDGDTAVLVSRYCIEKRDPLYCGAEASCLWELSKLTNHYHPTVQVFAKNLLKGEDIKYSGDPLNDFTILRFLDQFVHKNPKQTKRDKGVSVRMQPTHNLLNTRPYSLPMSLNELANMEQEKVREDLRFIHDFMKRDKSLHQGKYMKKLNQKKDKLMNKRELSSESDQEESEDFAGELVKTVKRKEKRKKEEKKETDSDESDSGDASYSDMDLSDFEDNDMLSDSEASQQDDNNRAQHKHKKRKKSDEMNEAELEKLLLDNMSSDDDYTSDDEVQPADEQIGKRQKKNTRHDDMAKKQRRKGDLTTLFASAEDFAHLLDKDVNTDSKKSQKQIEWEEKRYFSKFHKGRSQRIKDRGYQSRKMTKRSGGRIGRKERKKT